MSTLQHVQYKFIFTVRFLPPGLYSAGVGGLGGERVDPSPRSRQYS